MFRENMTKKIPCLDFFLLWDLSNYVKAKKFKQPAFRFSEQFFNFYQKQLFRD